MIKIKFSELENGLAQAEAVMRVLNKGAFVNSGYTKRFEEEWAEYCGSKYCVTTNSGYTALYAAIKALTNEGDSIIIPNLSFAATLHAVVETNRRPVFVDVTSQGLINWDMVTLELKRKDCAITAVMPVHLYGQKDLCIPDDELYNGRGQRVYIIEDACQAHGHNNFKGHCAAFSFYPSKNLGCVGDGGALITDDPAIEEYVRNYIHYGASHKHNHASNGMNGRMSEIQAAVLSSKLPKLSDAIRKRQMVAAEYAREGFLSFAQTKSVYHLYPIIVENPAKLRGDLEAAGIETGLHYPYTLESLWLQDSCYQSPTATFISNHHITLPMHPNLTSDDVKFIAKSLRKYK